ncbi:MAG TPA: glycosyltransferase family 2 protein [Bacteroidales bacterium]|nr:glycosyltransferase family 2 protein [Bacteroidales bacterium]HPF03687.1 glycosyltransferase family 2 protein [Bacteroidales bacterium]HPJ60282.1 glycosyltransferase family 2 protein [Bacteroidales bacterium]HPR13149.1 glycosyltransferase family 2 protein [Bacteroidales bacterium]HRW85043.1 glycosyltransferase family 2 protein [Bacteroidales bacterium]
MFSLVIPIFNEEKLIDELVSRSVEAVGSFVSDYEIIFIDDGSSDKSLDKLLQHREKNKKLTVISLSRNFGHQAAYSAGLAHARGDIVAMMDGDLQDPPELLADMYRKITSEDYDVVDGKKSRRKGSKGRNLYAVLFHNIFRLIGDLKDMENYGNFSMMKRNALEALLSMSEKVRYLPGMRSFIGFRHGEVEFVRDNRYRGKSKMSIRRLFILASDAIFSFSRFPIRLCLILGTLGTLVFLGAGIWVIIAKATGIAVPGWSSTLLSIYFLGSIQLVFLGVVGEYVFRNYKESQNRPLFFIRKIYEGDIQK